MQRDRATEILTSMLIRLCDDSHDPLLETVSAIDVFGSYARGAPEPGDIDVNIELDSRGAKKLLGLAPYDLSGRDETAVRRALFGGSRVVNVITQARRAPGMYPFPLTVLWQSGDSLKVALHRLQAIALNPSATRAEREHMLPAFEGIDKWLPIWLRRRITETVQAGAIEVDQIEIPDARVSDPDIAWQIDYRWKSGGPLNRAAHSVVAWLALNGMPHHQVHLHGQDMSNGANTPYIAGFQLRYIDSVPRLCTEYGARLILEIPHPTRTRPLVALQFKVLNPASFPTTHGDVTQWTIAG